MNTGSAVFKLKSKVCNLKFIYRSLRRISLLGSKPKDS